jgi:phosphoribosyl 1,2-cyclic phosphodiesterase
MEVTFWGVRGSHPVPGPNTVRYGGQTSCVEVRNAAGDCLVVDAGTGLRA